MRSALEADGWLITADPYPLSVGGVDMQIDLGAEKLLAALKDGERIAVEVKSFTSPSAVSEFHTALGQYLNYRLALAESDPERHLYLAVPYDTFTTFFQLPFPTAVVAQHRVSLVVYHPREERIVQWIP